MKLLLLLMTAISFTGCTVKEKQIKLPEQKPKPSVIAAINYDSCKTAIKINKQKFKAVWSSLPKTAKEKVFTDAVTETIIPAWIGTAWDFNGITETPQKGNIACGYFVTTVLRDAGLPIARVKLAQCASGQMITSLVQSKYISHYSNVLLEDFI
jgi:hypothetical protein